MKKLFAIVVLASVLTACNDGKEETNTSATDSTLISTESPLMDAVNTADSAGKVMEAGKDSAVKATQKTQEELNP